MASTKVVEQQPRPVMLLMSWGELVRVIIVGAIVGLVTLALHAMLDKYVLTPTLCSAPELAARCASKPYFAAAVATIISAVIGLFALVQQRVYRPLFVVLLATAGLWNVVLLLVTLPLWAGVVGALFAFASAYAVFAWLAQIRNFIVALIVALALVLVMRLIVSA